MPRIIKSQYVNISEDAHKIDVPEINLFTGEYGGEDEFVGDYDEEPSPEELLRRAEESAAEIIAEAKRDAEKIIAAAVEEAEREKDAIFERARKDGYEDGCVAAEREGQRITGMAEKTLSEAIAEKERVLRELEPEVVSLIIDIVDKLTGDIVRLNPGIILSIVKMGLWGAPQAKELSVRVSAEDFEAAQELKEEILSYVASDTELTLVKDTSLERGGCVIDTPVGSVECSLDAQWNALKNDLIQILKAGL